MDTTIDKINIETELFHKPSLNLRVKAMFVDMLIVICTLMIVSLALSYFNINPDLVYPILIGMFLLYEPIAVSLGGTIGQRTMGLRVRKANTIKESNSYSNIGIGFSLIRFIAKFLLGTISLISIHHTNYGQAIHDKLSGSVVTFK